MNLVNAKFHYWQIVNNKIRPVKKEERNSSMGLDRRQELLEVRKYLTHHKLLNRKKEIIK